MPNCRPPSTARQPHTDGLPASPTCTYAHIASVVTLSVARALGWAWGWAGGRTWSRKREQPNQESAKATQEPLELRLGRTRDPAGGVRHVSWHVGDTPRPTEVVGRRSSALEGRAGKQKAQGRTNNSSWRGRGRRTSIGLSRW